MKPKSRTTHQIILQGQALLRAIEALETIKATGPIKGGQGRCLLQAYRPRLRAIVAAAPTWVSEETLSASEDISDDRPVLWMRDD